MTLFINSYEVLLYMIKDENSGTTPLPNPPDYMPSGKRLNFSVLLFPLLQNVHKVAVKLKWNIHKVL